MLKILLFFSATYHVVSQCPVVQTPHCHYCCWMECSPHLKICNVELCEFLWQWQLFYFVKCSLEYPWCLISTYNIKSLLNNRYLSSASIPFFQIRLPPLIKYSLIKIISKYFFSIFVKNVLFQSEVTYMNSFERKVSWINCIQRSNICLFHQIYKPTIDVVFTRYPNDFV